MLLSKYWLETKSRFFIGAIFISAVCLFFVLSQPWILHQWALDEQREPDQYVAPWVGIAKKDYAFFLWRFLYNYLLQLTWVVFTVMLALGGLPHEQEKGSALFTLSLPVGRRRLFFQRVLVGYGEAIALALLPALLLPVSSLLIRQHYNFFVGVNHSLLFIAGGIVFYSVGVFINTVIKTEAVSFFLGVSLVILFYFLFQPYAEGMEKPRWLKWMDLPGLMAGDTSTSLLRPLPTVRLLSYATVSMALVWLSYIITRKRDF